MVVAMPSVADALDSTFGALWRTSFSTSFPAFCSASQSTQRKGFHSGNRSTRLTNQQLHNGPWPVMQQEVMYGARLVVLCAIVLDFTTTEVSRRW